MGPAILWVCTQEVLISPMTSTFVDTVLQDTVSGLVKWRPDKIRKVDVHWLGPKDCSEHLAN